MASLLYKPCKQALTALAIALLLHACGGGGGGSNNTVVTPPPPPAFTYVDSNLYSSAANASLQTPNEITTVTHKSIAIDGVTYNYTATTGHMTARTLGTGEPQASFFYVAYTLDGAPAATRPVTFFYNGGPGSATVWLHLGSFGPVRLVSGVPSTAVQTPFPLVDNAESMLDISDLVFVDAIGTGLSQAITPYANRNFWGVDSDATVFRDFVMRYLIANNRNASPKFLFGESYGTTRSAVLAHRLESAGVALNGVILQSSVLDYNANCGVTESLTSTCHGYLPTYGASGAWYNLLNPNPTPAMLTDFIAQTRTFATTQYQPALSSYLLSGAVPTDALLNQLVNITGLSFPKWQTHFNLAPGYFQSNLINGTIIGRYDSRVSAPLGSALARENDPSITSITPSFVAGMNNYLLATLQFTTPSSYVSFSNAIESWNFSHGGNMLPDTVPDLAAAMALNPRLKVFSANGYHDLATPFFVTELDLARLGTNPNIVTRNYSGGHMTYLDDAARRLQKADMVQFYRSAVAP